MNIKELRDYLINNVPNFEDPKIIEHEGECFHYTRFWEMIRSSGKFEGAPINTDLDKTQTINQLEVITEDLGVVFAYQNIQDARDEGAGLDIIQIRYRTCISALHTSENELGNLFDKALKEGGIEIEKNITPNTLLILTNDIISFDFVERAP